MHRDLAKTGRLDADLAASYSDLMRLRMTGSYGVTQHVSRDEAEQAIQDAQAIIDAVRRISPEPWLPGDVGDKSS